MKHSQEKLLNVTRVVLLDTLCRTLTEIAGRRGPAGCLSNLDEHEFIDAAKDIIGEAIAAEDVAIDQEVMVAKAVIEDLHFAFEEANRDVPGASGSNGSPSK
jgi:hypothetical protein